jgi:hypothetical protein
MQYLPVRVTVFLNPNQLQPTTSPEATTVNSKPLVSSQGQALQLLEQAPMIEGTPQYMDIRFSAFFQFLVNQSQFTSTPEFVVTNSKASSSVHV